MKKLIVMVALLLGFATPAFAALQVDVTQANVQPMPIAIPDFQGGTSADLQASANIAGVVRADLERSGLFKPLDQKGFVNRVTDLDAAPAFADWRTIKAPALLVTKAWTEADGQLHVGFRLYDVYGEQQINFGGWKTPPDTWRRLAHKISDAVYEKITGEKGYFDTRVVFVSESGPAINRVKRLAIMDEDGANPIFLTNGSYMVLTPRFNPSAQTIAYMSYIGTKPRVYLFDIETGKQEKLGDFPNMTFSPRFSPDGNKVAMSLENGGNSDIYVLDLRSRTVQRLTNDPAIDTAPSFSPDGNRIAFESDRGGSQQIYVMNVDGSNQHRISFGPGRNGTPVWSPRGDLVGFTKQDGGRFAVGVMRADGSGERLLTNGYEDEGPVWAPNGRVLMFTRSLQGGRGAQIWSVDLTGRNERRVTTPGDASDPAWSPLIQ